MPPRSRRPLRLQGALALTLLVAGCPDEASAPPVPGAHPPAAPGALPADPSAVVTRRTDVSEAPRARSDRDQEPNDTRASAMELRADGTVRGFIDPPKVEGEGDQDWYRLDVGGSGPTLLSAELDGADDLDLVLEWMPAAAPAEGAKDRALVQADVNEKRPGPEYLPSLRVGPGPVFFRVREAWWRGKPRRSSDNAYRLKVSASTWAPGLEAEPNDDEEHAVPLAFGETGRGVLGHIKDRDVFRIPLGSEARGNVITASVSGVAGVQMGVDLRWAGAKTGLTEARSEPGQGVTFRRLAVPLSGVDALLVILSARKGAQPRASYDVRVSLEEPTGGEASAELEPNDTEGAATRLGGPGTTVGWLDRPGDRDHISVLVDRPTSLHAVLEAPLDLDVELALLGPDGDGRARIDEGKAGEAEVLRAFGVAPGIWTLVVRGAKPELHDPQRAWSLEVELADAEADEMEPNDARDAPALSRIGRGDERRGWIHPREDVDWWRLDLTSEESAGIVTVRVRPPPAVVLDVSLHGPDGTKVAGRTGLMAPDASTFTHFVEPGSWLLRVSGARKEAASARDAYSLEVLR